MKLQEHILEIKNRLTICGIILGIVFVICFYFANELYTLISTPIITKLPQNIQLITTKVTAPFMVPFKLSLIVALILCAPLIIYHLWAFIRPGLYKRERQLIYPLALTSLTLFYFGMIFAWLIICPVALKFFSNSAPNGVLVMFDIGDYLDFIVTIAFASGLAFQIPVITHILIKTGIMSKEQLTAKRKHVIVIALVVGMLLAPPDVISQLLLAIPMWLLFEMGLISSKLYL